MSVLTPSKPWCLSSCGQIGMIDPYPEEPFENDFEIPELALDLIYE
jgi:hypothetical protein